MNPQNEVVTAVGDARALVTAMLIAARIEDKTNGDAIDIDERFGQYVIEAIGSHPDPGRLALGLAITAMGLVRAALLHYDDGTTVGDLWKTYCAATAAADPTP
jgi:hypothetical protein